MYSVTGVLLLETGKPMAIQSVRPEALANLIGRVAAGVLLLYLSYVSLASVGLESLPAGLTLMSSVYAFFFVLIAAYVLGSVEVASVVQPGGLASAIGQGGERLALPRKTFVTS